MKLSNKSMAKNRNQKPAVAQTLKEKLHLEEQPRKARKEEIKQGAGKKARNEEMKQGASEKKGLNLGKTDHLCHRPLACPTNN